MEEPDCFLLDYSNKTLATILPDSKSLKFALQHLGQIEDVNVRLQLWNSLRLMVNNEMILPTEVIRTILDQFGSEESQTVREFVLGIYYSAIFMMPEDVREKWRPRLVTWCNEMIQERRFPTMLPNFAQILWQNSQHDPQRVEELYQKVDTDLGIEGFQVPKNLWILILTGAFAHKVPGVQERVEKMIAETPWMNGIKAATPDLEIKLGWYKWMTFQNDSPPILGNMLGVMFLPYQKEITKHIREKFFEDAIGVTRNPQKTVEFLNVWIPGMFSGNPEEDGILEKVQTLLDQLSDNGNDLCLKEHLLKFLGSSERKKRIWQLERKANGL